METQSTTSTTGIPIPNSLRWSTDNSKADADLETNTETQSDPWLERRLEAKANMETQRDTKKTLPASYVWETRAAVWKGIIYKLKTK